MKVIRALACTVALCAISAGLVLGQASLPTDRKQAKKEIDLIKSRIKDWGLPSESFRIDDEKALEDVILFIQDPVSRFDSIKYLDNHQLWNYIGMYDYVLKGSRGIGTFYFFEHLENLLVPVDAKKVNLVTYLMHDSQPDGVYGEWMSDLYTKLFGDNPILFANDLKTRSDWKNVIGDLACGDYEAMTAGLTKLGNTKFELELKEYWAECMNKWSSIRWL